MILLDTNVVSAMTKTHYDPVMAKFTSIHKLNELFLPSIVAAEIRYGIHRLPAGRRRNEIEQDFEDFLRLGFANRMLVFDAACAKGYAIARATRMAAGRPISAQDALIGGMALAYGATLATRNIPDFEGYGLTLINPWDPAKNLG